MYATLEQFKTYLWMDVGDTSQDSVLTDFLLWAESMINNYCGVDSFSQDTYEELIDERGIYSNNYGLFFYVKNKPVSTVAEIAWSSDVGTKWVDYLVVNDRGLIFKKLPSTTMGFLKVKYTAWYEVIPGDLQLVEMMLASGLYQQKGNEWVSSYKLWDESIVFWSKASGDGDSDLAYFKVKTLLDKYKSFNLPY